MTIAIVVVLSLVALGLVVDGLLRLRTYLNKPVTPPPDEPPTA
ncbi:hypothetical protein [Mycobacterium sp. MYCO198283]|nr:hypothetical protein [Mycobacterium sp. MYCO198283]